MEQVLEDFELDGISMHAGECTAADGENLRSGARELLHELGITTKPGCVQENFVRFLLTFHASNRNILRSCNAHARYWASGFGPLND
jgi:hypothetical protein